MRKRGTTSDDEKDLALYSDGYDGSLNATIPQQYVFIEEEDESSISRQTNGILPPPPIRKSSSLSVPGRLKRRVKGGKQRKNDGSTRNHKSSTLFRWHKLFHRVQMSQYSCLCLAVLLWYSLGVISISTSKLLLTPSKHHIRSPRYYYHAGGVAPLILTLQQLFLGSNFLRFLLNIRFMNSAGLQSYASLGSADSLLSSSSPRERRRLSKQKDDWNTIINLLQNEHSRYLVYAGICFTVGFWATNVGFHGTSASFVETIKAAEPVSFDSMRLAEITNVAR